VGVKHRYTRG